MEHYIQAVKAGLLQAIDAVESLKHMYVPRPGQDFTRDRKLSFSTVIKLVLQMEGGTLGKNTVLLLVMELT